MKEGRPVEERYVHPWQTHRAPTHAAENMFSENVEVVKKTRILADYFL